jgi:hypothetical protein
VHKVRTNKSGTAGHQHTSHGLSLKTRSAISGD